MQSKKISAYESLVQTTAGVVMGFLIQKFIFPLPFIDIHFSNEQNLKAVILFFIASLIRQYGFRRLFNFIKYKKK